MAAMMPLMDFLESGHFVQSIKHGCEWPACAPAAYVRR